MIPYTADPDFFYNANGTPIAMRQSAVGSTNYTIYYYITNLQGDVIRLVNHRGETAAYYRYDPYGKVIEASGSHANINPLRYRGYYYDVETGLYYLQSRYYDPQVGRFINADKYPATGQGLIGNNMFAYCGNSPIARADTEGTFFFTVLGAVVGAGISALDAWMTGGTTEDIIRGAEAGFWSGGIAGAGVDLGIATVASGGTLGAAAGIAAGLGALVGVVGTGISTDWQADPMDYTASALVSGSLNLVSLVTATVGRIAEGTFKQIAVRVWYECGYYFTSFMENTVVGAVITETAIWVTRFMTGDYQHTSSKMEVAHD